MADFTDEFKINVNKLNADECSLVCIEIVHPFLLETIRLVNDSNKLISNGETYLPIPFEIKMNDDIEGELPKVTLSVQNVGRLLTKWVDASGGAKNSTFDVLIIRRSQPNVIEERLSLGVDNVKTTTERIQFNLIIQNNLIKKSMRYIYDINRSPGLF